MQFDVEVLTLQVGDRYQSALQNGNFGQLSNLSNINHLTPLVDKYGELIMRVKTVYRKNLKMSEGKIAAQVAHAIIGLGVTDPMCTIVVLGVSDKKFNDLTEEQDCYVCQDAGYTEIEPGTKTAAAWME